MLTDDDRDSILFREASSKRFGNGVSPERSGKVEDHPRVPN